jgi:hypothetical protein
MSRTDALTRGRTAYARCDWTDAYTHLCGADHDTPLPAEDLEHLATAAYLIGKDAESAAVWARAHQSFLTRGEKTRAVRCAFWLAFGLRANHRGFARRGELTLTAAPVPDPFRSTGQHDRGGTRIACSST